MKKNPWKIWSCWHFQQHVGKVVLILWKWYFLYRENKEVSTSLTRYKLFDVRSGRKDSDQRTPDTPAIPDQIKGVKWRYPRQKPWRPFPAGFPVTPKKVVSLGSGNPEPQNGPKHAGFQDWFHKLPRRYGIHVPRCWRFLIHSTHFSKENLRLSHCQIPAMKPIFLSTWMMYNYICFAYSKINKHISCKHIPKVSIFTPFLAMNKNPYSKSSPGWL